MESGYSWDTGQARKLNEDSILCITFELRSHLGAVSAGLFAVADGMGGHNAGEIASDLAARTLQAECISGLLAQAGTPPLSVLKAAFNKANNAIVEAARDLALQGMGTTLTAALVIDQDLYIAHIGDSRCYIINNREVLQITRDHSLVQQLVDDGLLTQEKARLHPRRNEITRVLGYVPDTPPDLFQVKLYADDNIMLCSDGLHGILDTGTIGHTVNTAPDANKACIDLTAAANAAGGPDNISVIIIKHDNLPSWQAMISARTSVRPA
jgi:serine/threonine protein phosphatase PrpC